MTVNPLLQTLYVINALGCSDATAATLEQNFAISSATLKRCISEARLMGAKIVSQRSGSLWVYTLQNFADLKNLKVWIDLEEKRDLTA